MFKSSTLSVTAGAVLTAAVNRGDRLALPPRGLPVAAWRSVVNSLLKTGLLEEVPANDDQAIWRSLEDGGRLTLRATNAGAAAVGITVYDKQTTPTPSDATVAESPTPPSPLSPASPRRSIRAAIDALLAAWDADPAQDRPMLASAMGTLRTALPLATHSRTVSSRQPRPNRKRATVLALLRRPEGATVAQVAEATGWATHTVRGFFAGLKKAGIPVEVVERVKQVGAGQGNKGSYSVYRVAA